MSLVRRAVGATAITAASRSSVPSALRRLAAPLVFLVALLAVSLGIASPALAAAPTAGNFGPGGTAYNSGSNPPLVFSVLPHVAGGATSFAMTSATSDMGGTVSITNGGTVTYVPPIGFKGADWVYYTASNVDGTSAVATIHISVNWPIIAVTLPSNLGTVGVPYNVGGAPLVISGGFAPYTISFSDPFPAGLSFNPATRVLSGTPTSAGGVDVNYIVEDSSYGQTGNQVEPGWFTLNIAAPTITVSPASLGGTPQIGAAYSQSLTASGGASPYRYSITAGALPAGLTLSAAGVISGTPTAAGAFSATVKATDNSGYPGTRVYAATVVGPAMTVGAGPLPGGSLGAAYTASVTATGGTGPYTYDRAFGTLPTGLTLSPSGALSGTPTAGGTFNFTVRATDSSTGANAPFIAGQTFVVTITAPTITVSPGGLFDGQIGQAYSANVTASGSQGPYSFAVTAGALPAGLSLGVGGALTGVPTTTGAFNFTVTATDGNAVPAHGARAYSLTIVGPNLTLQPGVLTAATFGEAYSVAFLGGGGSSPYAYQLTAGAIPPGLTLSAAGLLSGTPTAQGPFNFSITTTDSTTGQGPYSLAQAYSLLVSPPAPPVAGPAILTLPANSPGEPVVLNLGGGAANSVAVAATAPAHGTVTVAGLTMTYIPAPGYSGPDSFTYTATNLSGNSPEATVTITVTPPTLTLSALPTTGQVTAPYSVTAMASLGSAPYSFVRSAGTLPTGLTLAADGTLSGTPTAAGPFNFTLEATDANGAKGVRAYAVTIAAPIVAITGPAAGGLPDVPAGTAYSQGFTATGGQGAHAFNITAGALPPGLILSGSGVLSGTPTTPGAFNFSITPRDSSLAPGPYVGAPSAYSLTVTALTIMLSPTTLPNASTATVYNAALVASGGAGAYDYSVTAGSLPPGLGLGSAGALSGTLTASGLFNFTITATDSLGFTGAQAFSVTVSDPLIAVTAPVAGALPPGQGGVAYSQNFTATGGQDARSFVITGGTLPAGLSLSPTGALSGTPTASGAFNFSVGATDGSPAPGPFSSSAVNYTLLISAPMIMVSPSNLPDANTATLYNETIVASGGVGAYDYSVTVGTLPTGLGLSNAGALSGTLTASGLFNFTITATDSLGFTGAQAFSVTVSDPVVVLTAPAAGALPAGQGGVAYSQAFTATGGLGAHSFVVTGGTLPAGMSLSSAGTLSGTPTASGAFTFAISATDASTAPGPFASMAANYTLQIAAPTLIVSPTSGALPGGLITAPYSQSITAAGGAAPYGFTLTVGALPGGLILSTTGSLTGTPTSAGNYSFSVTAVDAFGFSQTAAYTLEIGTPIPVVTAKSATLVAGQSVTVDVTADAIGGPFTAASVTTVPAHGVAAVSGLNIVYTPNGTYTGPDSFAYTLTNAGGPSLPALVSITVNAAIAAAPPKTVTILAGQTATVELTAGATGAPFTGASLVSLSPANAGTATVTARSGSTGQSYDLVFKPNNVFNGQAVVTYTLSNAVATSAPGTVTIIVEMRADPTRDPEVSALISAQTETARRFATAQLSNINRRLEHLHDGDGGSGFSSSLSFSGGNSALAGGMASDANELQRLRAENGMIDTPIVRAATASGNGGAAGIGTEDVSGYSAGGGTGPAFGSWSVWLSGAASFGTSDAAVDRKGFEFDTDGLTIGADRRLDDQTVIGGALGWAHDVSEIGDSGTRSQADAWSVSLYGSYEPGSAAFVDAVLGYGQLAFDIRRYVTANGDFAYSQRDGSQWYGSLTMGWDYRHPRGLHLSPYGRIEAAHSGLDASTEEGGGVFALQYEDQETKTVTGALGLRGDYAVEASFGNVVPNFRVEYAYDLKGSGAARIRYADWLDGQMYSMTATPYDKNRVLYGLGFDLLRASGMRFGLDYEGTLSKDQTGHAIRIMLETSF